MNPQEIELAGKVMSELKNSTGYGYDTLVQGTVLANALDLFGIALWVASLTLVAKYLWRKFELSKDDNDGQMGSFALIVVVIAIVLWLIYATMLNAICGLIAPEYTVIHEIVERTI